MMVAITQLRPKRLSLLIGSGGIAATAQTLFVNVFIIGINIATGIITARTLGAAGRGAYSAMILWPQFLALILTCGLPSALIYHSKRAPAEARIFFSAVLWMGLALSFVAALLGLVLIPRWMTQYPIEAVRFAQWTMALMPIAMLTEISIGAFRAREEFGLYNRLRVLTPVLTLIGFGDLLWLGAMTPLNAAIATLTACSLVGASFTLHHVRACRPVFAGLASSARRLFSYGWRASGNDLLVNLSLQADALLVVALLSPEAMGFYTVALSLSRSLNVFSTAVVNVLFPRTAGRSVAEVIATTGRALRVTLIAVIAIAMALMLTAESLLRFVYGAEFVHALPVFRLLLIEAILTCAFTILLQPFLALERPGVVSLLQGIGLALSLVLLLLLIPLFGLLGAGLALLLAGACRLILVWWSYSFFLQTKPPRLLFAPGDFALARSPD
ncbi:MAG: oligosaccharide flippase family protein [Blastocatellia bacterium]|nr:oligosaccharide flippase family protein [Blastocatellia bacterium]